jgi:hypothetical protein
LLKPGADATTIADNHTHAKSLTERAIEAAGLREPTPSVGELVGGSSSDGLTDASDFPGPPSERGRDVPGRSNRISDGHTAAGVLAESPRQVAEFEVAHKTNTQRVSDQIVGQIAARAATSTRDGRTDLHIRLEPPELGAVRVHLIASEHAVTARLVVSDEAARQLIESQLHTLRESLASVGVALERFDVASDAGGSHGQWDWQQPEPVWASSGLLTPQSRQAGAQDSESGSKVASSILTARRIDVVV